VDHSFLPPQNETDFERFCTELLRVHWSESVPQRWGRRGQKQHGVDIVDMSGTLPLRGAQAKFRKNGVLLTRDEVANEVAQARGFDIGGTKLGHYTILTTSENDTDLQAAVIAINLEHRRKELFQVELLTWEAIEHVLRGNPGLWDQITGRTLRALVTPLTDSIAVVRSDVSIIRSEIERQQSQTPADDIDDQLTTIRLRLESHDYEVASLLLMTLRANKWSELKGSQRFLCLTYLARVAYAKDDWHHAGRLFIEAEHHLPGDERASINRALGLELLCEKREAESLARKIVVENPTLSRAWAIVVRTASDDVLARALESEMPVAARADAEVRVALAMRATRVRAWNDAIEYVALLVQADTDWAAPWLIYGQSKQQAFVEGAYKCADEPIPNSEEPTEEVIRSLTRALELADRSRSRWMQVQALIGRSRAKANRGDEKGAECDIEAAYALAPNNAAAVFYYGVFLFSRDRGASAISMLRKAVSLEPTGDAHFLLGLALSHEHGATGADEWLQHASAAANDPACHYRLMAIEMVLDLLIGRHSLDEAQEFLARCGVSGLAPLVVSASEIWLAHGKGEGDRARELAVALADGIQDGESTPGKRFFAEVLLRVGELTKALPLWESIAEKTRQIPDVWRLIDVAKRLDRPDVIRKVADDWRAAGARDNRLIEEELNVLARYEPLRAVARVSEELSVRKNDPSLLLRQSILGIRLGRSELVCLDVARLPSPTDAKVHVGAMVAWVLANGGAVAPAIKYAYTLFRHHPRNPQAQQLFAWLMLAFASEGRDDLAKPPETISAGTAVQITDRNGNEARWVVIGTTLAVMSSTTRFPQRTHSLARCSGSAKAMSQQQEFRNQRASR
jgi:tetratricopeptide (TPR) repeat protein